MMIHPKRGYIQDRSHQHQPSLGHSLCRGQKCTNSNNHLQSPHTWYFVLQQNVYSMVNTFKHKEFLQLYLKTNWWRLLKGEQLCQKSSTSKSGITKITTPPTHYRIHDHIHWGSLMKIKWCIYMYTHTFMYIHIYVHLKSLKKSAQSHN